MARVVAFLRGINLGRRRVKNEALVAAAEAVGFTQVEAYQASGNLLLDPGADRDPEPTLSAGLEAALGFEVLVVVRTAAELRALASAAPFSAEDLTAAKPGKTMVTVVPEPVSEAARAAVEAMSTEADRVVVGEAAWFWLPRGGVSKSSLDTGSVERWVGVGTNRTQATLQRLVKKLDA